MPPGTDPHQDHGRGDDQPAVRHFGAAAGRVRGIRGFRHGADTGMTPSQVYLRTGFGPPITSFDESHREPHGAAPREHRTPPTHAPSDPRPRRGRPVCETGGALMRALATRIKWIAATPGTVRGMGWMLISAFTVAIFNGIVRHLSTDVHPFEIAFVHSAFGVLFLAPVYVRGGLAPLKTRRSRCTRCERPSTSRPRCSCSWR